MTQERLFGQTDDERRREQERLHALWHEAERWGPALCHPDHAQPEWTGCQASIEERYEYPEGWYDENERRSRDLWPKIHYRGWCLGCGWRGADRDDEGAAVEDVHDHAWPGWRDLPLMPDKPLQAVLDRKVWQRWANECAAAAASTYPEGWLQRGGAPIRTVRYGIGTRHVERYSPFGGYDLCGEARPEHDDPSTRQRVPKGGDTHGKKRGSKARDLDADPPSRKRRPRRAP